MSPHPGPNSLGGLNVVEVVCDLGAARCAGVRSTGELQDLDTNAATSLLESGLFCCHMGGESHH